MLTRFIREHQDLIDQVRDEWTDHFFSLQFDQERAEQLIDFLYEGISRRVTKVFVDSPRAVQSFSHNKPFQEGLNPLKDWYATEILDQWDIHMGPKMENRVQVQIREKVHSQFLSYLLSSFWSHHRSAVEEQVRGCMDKHFEHDHEPNGGAKLGSRDLSLAKRKAFSKLLPRVESQLVDQVLSRFGLAFQTPAKLSQLKTHVEFVISSHPSTERFPSLRFSPHGDFSDIDWVSFYDAFQRAGELPNETFAEYKELLKANIFLWVPLKTYAFVSKPPVLIEMDAMNRLHCEDGYALRFSDGYGQHWFEGVYFEPEVFDKFFKVKDFNAKDILTLRNTEQKAVLIQHHGFDVVEAELKAKSILDVYEGVSVVTGKPLRYELIDCLLEHSYFRFIKVEDHSTHKTVTLGVPIQPSTATCRGAIAWTFGLSEEEYFPEIEA